MVSQADRIGLCASTARALCSTTSGFFYGFFYPRTSCPSAAGLLGFKLEDVLISTGPWVLVVSAIIVFIESGVLFPVLPGDSLIFALGMLHDRMGLSLWLAFPVLIIAAVVGGEVGYQLGARYGRNLFKDDAKILSTKNLHAAEDFLLNEAVSHLL